MKCIKYANSKIFFPSLLAHLLSLCLCHCLRLHCNIINDKFDEIIMIYAYRIYVICQIAQVCVGQSMNATFALSAVVVAVVIVAASVVVVTRCNCCLT